MYDLNDPKGAIAAWEELLEIDPAGQNCQRPVHP